MNPEDKKYIFENTGKRSAGEIASHLGLKERKVKKFIEQNKHDKRKGASSSAVISERQTVFSAKQIPYIFIILLIVAAGFIAYSNSFHSEFVFDDVQQVMNNTVIRSLGNIPAIFTHDLIYYGGKEAGKFYRPIQSLTYVTDYFLWGKEPFGYHVTNTILHIVVCILLFFVISRITANRLLSTATTLLYLVHPIHTEAVTYISGRADSLCAIFLLTGTIFLFRYWDIDKKLSRITDYAAVMIFFILALLTKEVAVVFPILWIFMEYCLRDRDKYDGSLKRKLIFYLPIIALAAVWLLIKNMIVPTEAMAEDPYTLNLAVSLKTIPRVMFDYLRLSILPFNLHMEYKLPFPRSIFQQGYFGPFAFILVFIPFVYFIWKKGRYDINYRILFFGLGWFIVALLPYLNIFFRLNAPFSEHWLYIPEMGLLLFIVYMLFYLSVKSAILKKATILFCVGSMIFFSYLTVRQNAVWRDRITFYTYTIKYAPYSEVAYNNLGVEYMDKKEFVKAKGLFEKAVELAPDYALAVENLRIARSATGDTQN
ncbi:MAG: tetratricopeptide repeat protein [Candidatus Omnitrophota bacterium]|nr:tetratricopeptide repeat protein [Candidatus Omnitrophota bacterium]